MQAACLVSNALTIIPKVNMTVEAGNSDRVVPATGKVRLILNLARNAQIPMLQVATTVGRGNIGRAARAADKTTPIRNLAHHVEEGALFMTVVMGTIVQELYVTVGGMGTRRHARRYFS